jgi:hypothetical protein
MVELTQARLREQLSYDPATGLFTRLRPSGTTKAGDVAGTKTGVYYSKISVDGKPYQTHRLVWLYVHGYLPATDIDHIDGDKQNNRLSNLREVSRSVNMQNIKVARTNNKVGLLGVCKHGPSYRAQITANGKVRKLGVFKTEALAHAAYLSAKRALHEGCTI